MDCKKRNFIIQFIKFNLVGIINTLITYFIYCILVLFRMHHFIALSVDYLTGVIITFTLNKNFTFKNKSPTSIFMFIKMLFIYLIVFSLNIFLLFLFIDIYKFNKIVSQFFVQATLAFLSFIFQKNFVFKERGV